MSKRAIAPLILREFQAEAVDTLAGAMIDTIAKIKAAPTRRREITRRIGCALLEAPTASGKTVMLAATAERVSANTSVVWFWFAPFKGVIDQTITAVCAAAPALRVRDPKTDRVAVGTRSGDVFIATWASVAASNKESRKMRMDDDELPALDSLVTQLRQGGMELGAVVDEAHHSFKAGSEAFKFFDEILRPDLLMLATATPDDSDVELLRRTLEIERFQRISVSRERVVEARLNKKSVKAISFVAKGTNKNLLDLNEVALRKAVDQHRSLKKRLKEEGIQMVPLLLVQAASTRWTPERVKDFLLKELAFSENSVGKHTAEEPDPDVQALANDPQIEVLVFKMAVATGFDAPRASTLCALRAVQDKGFGLQVIGRIMRVHPVLQTIGAIPAEFDCGYVFLGDAESQLGLQQAARQVQSLRNMIEVSTARIEIYIASAGDNGEITIEDEHGQRALVLTPPESGDAHHVSTEAQGVRTYRVDEQTPLFDLLDQFRAQETAATIQGSAATKAGGSFGVKSFAEKAFNYPARANIEFPRRLLTEKMPSNVHVLVEELVKNVTFTSEHLNMVRQHRTDVERQEVEIFGAIQSRRTMERAEISDLFAKQNAWQLLRVSDHIDPQELAKLLLEKLERTLENSGQDAPDLKILRRALNIILVRNPSLCREALKRAMAACAEVIEADDLPLTFSSDFPLEESRRNLYNCRPLGLNTWEAAFADWLDIQEERVVWWIRNLQTRRTTNDWGVRIILPESGKGYQPDFIVCVNGRKKQDGIALLETKERIAMPDSISKSRSEHRVYGKAIMVTYDEEKDKFFRIQFDPATESNRVVGGYFESNDLIMD